MGATGVHRWLILEPERGTQLEAFGTLYNRLDFLPGSDWISFFDHAPDFARSSKSQVGVACDPIRHRDLVVG